MKKFLLIAIACFALSLGTTSAQAKKTIMPKDGKNTIGLRLGWDLGITYQRYLNDKNRIELDLMLPYGFNGVQLGGTYQWVWSLNNVTPGLKWYAGAGASLGYISSFSVGIHGQAGIEYSLKTVPLIFSVDYKPGIHISKEFGFGYTGFGGAVRYRF